MKIKVWRFQIVWAVMVSLSLFISKCSYAIDLKDSARVAVSSIDKAYTEGRISQKQFLDSVYKTMVLFQSRTLTMSKDEMQKLLTLYREVAWGVNPQVEYQKAYYSLLCGQARAEGRNAEMLYFAEKLNELEGNDNNRFSVSSIFYIISYHHSQFRWERIEELYKKCKVFIHGLPDNIRNLDRMDLMRAGDVLSMFGTAAIDAGDIELEEQLKSTFQRLADSVAVIYPEDKELTIRIQYSSLLAQYQHALKQGKASDILQNINSLDSLRTDEHTPEYLRNYLHFSILDMKAIFFLETANNDSASYYINLLQESAPPHSATIYMIKKYQARLLFNRGLYKASVDSLISALELIESINSSALSEADELMYTLTKVEDQQLLLEEAALKNRRQDRLIKWVALTGILVVIMVIGSFVYLRQRERRKFWEFKINLARNIHDEVGPALMYAHSLAKSLNVQEPDRNSKDELASHIGNTMAVIRSLSHDLKSDELCSLNSLVSEVDNTLSKLKNLNVFDYTIEGRLNGKRFISHYQFTQLRAVLQECITNSIKHAQFNHIYISLVETKNRLKIIYSDNGMGWPPGLQSKGIGINNINERMRLINAELTTDNRYPNGYRIEIVVPLR